MFVILRQSTYIKLKSVYFAYVHSTSKAEV